MVSTADWTRRRPVAAPIGPWSQGIMATPPSRI